MTRLPFSRDAATVVALAGSALSFASTTEEEAERWLRPLRLYGEAGRILQSLGIGEARLVPQVDSPTQAGDRPEMAVAAVIATARQAAARRGASIVGTADVLVAVLRRYPIAFGQALESRGCDRWELIDRVAESLQVPLR